jgi:hypothetical protein
LAEEELPEIAWLVEFRMALSACTPEQEVVLDISGAEFSDDEISTWHEDQTRWLADKVRAYSSTFESIVAADSPVRRLIARRTFADRWNQFSGASAEPYQRGRALEGLIRSALDEAHPGLVVVSQNLRNDTQEIDLVVKNQMPGTFWVSLNSPLIYVECKNWIAKVGVDEARVFESKLREVGPFCRVGIFIAAAGVTKPFISHVAAIRRSGYAIAVVGPDDIAKLVSAADGVATWFEQLVTRALLRGS